jgi:oxygen-independent coproporphyrinogen-3 oxidase
VNGGESFAEMEELNYTIRFNEYLMVSLRTNKGIDLQKITHEFGKEVPGLLSIAIQPWVNSNHIIKEGFRYRMTLKGWLISDFIISQLMHPEE